MSNKIPLEGKVLSFSVVARAVIQCPNCERKGPYIVQDMSKPTKHECIHCEYVFEINNFIFV